MPFIDDLLERICEQEVSNEDIDAKLPNENDVSVDEVSEEIREIVDSILNPSSDE